MITKIFTTALFTAGMTIQTLAAIPDRNCSRDFADGGIVYGWGELDVRFRNPDKTNRYATLTAPYGYYVFSGDGDTDVYIFKKPVITGDIAKVQADHYMMDYDVATDKEVLKPTGEIQNCTVNYNPVTNELTFDLGYGEMLFKNPDRTQFVTVPYNHNVNIRRTPVNGAIVGKAPQGRVYPYKGEKRTGNGTWLEIQLPDGTTGYISDDYAQIASDYYHNPNSIPEKAFSGRGSFNGPITGPEGEEIGTRNISFIKKGDRVLMDANEIYINGRIGASFYSLGRIEGNSIVFYKGVYDQMGTSGAFDAIEADDWNALERILQPYEDRCYFLHDTLYSDGESYEYWEPEE